MATQILNFTKSALTAATPPLSGRIYLKDEKTRGLILDVQSSGTKTFQVYRKFNGKPKRIVLGRFNPELAESRDLPLGTDPLSMIGNNAELNVRTARKLADAANASLDRGIDPASTAREARLKHERELTLRQAFDYYFSDHLIAHEKRSAVMIKDDFARYLGTVPPGQKKPRGKEKIKSAGAVDWERRKLSSISQDDVRKMLVSVKDKTGLRTANRILVMLRSIYNKMIEWKLYTGDNPCAGIQKFKENSHERYLTWEEAPRFWNALEKINHPDFKDFVLLSLFTGARRENVLSMRWQDLNLQERIWTVPGQFSKNGSPLKIPIVDMSCEILEKRKKAAVDCQVNSGTQNETNPFIFPADSKSGYMSPPNKRWKALLSDAKIENFRLHDLRHTLGTYAANGNTSGAIIGKMLGHKTSQATGRYMHVGDFTAKTGMEKAVGTIMEKANPKKKLPPLPPSE
ncbi:MAG: tyrosine-type recombinase/integrase [Burkholderiaceae bacterium]